MSDKLTTIQRLNSQVNIKDEKIEDLENELNELKSYKERGWQYHKFIKKKKNIRKNLPTPRIEMNFKTDGHNMKWEYGFVFNPFWETTGDLIYIPISRTTGTGRIHIDTENDSDFLPFRDGLHIKHDSLVFNLPIYFIWEKEKIIKEIKISDELKKHILSVRKSNN